ncbi:hypothetical protein ALC62_02137 [Cyphomyrmex costatus]|uniref:Uncharacterized protein n=1 Tax=Cyphomyrmex costatus TaxID=456900 RepID=A0A195D202_9HYME|nr:hypothetical protein ALC62_02137 [Cyphomyrmex costatus]
MHTSRESLYLHTGRMRRIGNERNWSGTANALAGRVTRGIMQMRFGDRRKPRRVKLVAVNYGMEIIPIRCNHDRATRNGDCSISGILASESDRKARKRDPYQLIEQIETGNTGSPGSWKSPSTALTLANRAIIVIDYISSLDRNSATQFCETHHAFFTTSRLQILRDLNDKKVQVLKFTKDKVLFYLVKYVDFHVMILKSSKMVN